MPVEPERHVEKLLRGYARRRREDAARLPELHPATRKLLQDEAAHTWSRGPADAAATERFGASLWMRLGMVGAVGAVIIGAVVFMRQDKGPAQMAKSEKASVPAAPAEMAGMERQAAVNESRTPTPAATPTISVVLADSGSTAQSPDLATTKPRVISTSGFSANRTAPALTVTATSSSDKPVATAPASAPLQKEWDDFRANLRWSKVEPKLLATYAAPGAPPSRGGPEMITQPEPLYGPYTELRQESAQLAEVNQTSKAIEDMTRQLVAAAQTQRALGERKSQDASGSQLALQVQQASAPQVSQRSRFRQLAAAPDQPQVMQSFTVEQTGQQIRIIEDDGSVYEGQITAAAVSSEARQLDRVDFARGLQKAEAATRLREAEAKADSAAPGPVPFVAVGFNRTLGQAVVFRGNFMPAPEQDAATFDSAVQAKAKKDQNAQAETESLKRAQALTAHGTNIYVGGAFTAAGGGIGGQSQSGAPTGGVQGKATVGGSVEVQIRAVPAQP